MGALCAGGGWVRGHSHTRPATPSRPLPSPTLSFHPSACGELGLLRGALGVVCICAAAPAEGEVSTPQAGSPAPASARIAGDRACGGAAPVVTHFVRVNASTDRVTSADVARRFALASGGGASAGVGSGAGVFGLTTPAQDSLPPDGDASRFTCGQVWKYLSPASRRPCTILLCVWV